MTEEGFIRFLKSALSWDDWYSYNFKERLENIFSVFRVYLRENGMSPTVRNYWEDLINRMICTVREHTVKYPDGKLRCDLENVLKKMSELLEVKNDKELTLILDKFDKADEMKESSLFNKLWKKVFN